MNFRGNSEVEGFDAQTSFIIKNSVIKELVLSDFLKEEKVCIECLQLFKPEEKIILISQSSFSHRFIPIVKPSLIHISCLEDFTSRLLNSHSRQIEHENINKSNQSIQDSSLQRKEEEQNVIEKEEDELNFP